MLPAYYNATTFMAMVLENGIGERGSCWPCAILYASAACCGPSCNLALNGKAVCLWSSVTSNREALPCSRRSPVPWAQHWSVEVRRESPEYAQAMSVHASITSREQGLIALNLSRIAKYDRGPRFHQNSRILDNLSRQGTTSTCELDLGHSEKACRLARRGVSGR